MNVEFFRKKDQSETRRRLGFALSTILLLISLELKPSQIEAVPESVIIFQRNQTTVSVGDYRGSASVVLSQKGEQNLLNVHLAEAQAYGGMLNAEFSGPLPKEGETRVYALDDMHGVWFVEKDINDRRTHGIFSLRREKGNYYGEVLDTGEPLVFVLTY